MPGFQGAISDVDGVLVDSPHEQAWRAALLLRRIRLDTFAAAEGIASATLQPVSRCWTPSTSTSPAGTSRTASPTPRCS